MSSSNKCWCGCSQFAKDKDKECNECVGSNIIQSNHKRLLSNHHCDEDRLDLSPKDNNISNKRNGDNLDLSPKDKSIPKKRMRFDHQYYGFDSYLTLERLRIELEKFANERDWDKYHQPRNLLIALFGEIGELSELFQWEGDKNNVKNWSSDKREHLGEELSDVLLYLLRLADKCEIDLSTAVVNKFKKNAVKYPVDKAKGKSDKYTAYQ